MRGGFLCAHCLGSAEPRRGSPERLAEAPWIDRVLPTVRCSPRPDCLRASVNSEGSRRSASQTALAIARHLLGDEGATPQESDADAAAVALQHACSRLVQALRDSMGEDGSSALLARALTRTKAAHPSVSEIRRIDAGQILLDGVVAVVRTHGIAKVAAGIEALFAALIDILIQLIGEDMTVRLVDDGYRPGEPGGGRAP